MGRARQRAFIRVDVASRLVVWVVCLSFCSCGYYHYAGPLKPLDEQGVALAVADDGSVTFTQDRFEVRLRYVTDRELNRQFTAYSKAGPKSTNPFTYGDTEFEAAERPHVGLPMHRRQLLPRRLPRLPRPLPAAECRE